MGGEATWWYQSPSSASACLSTAPKGDSKPHHSFGLSGNQLLAIILSQPVFQAPLLLLLITACHLL